MSLSCLPLRRVHHTDNDCYMPTAGHEVQGLRNLGNTCYFSAVLQSLLKTNLLMEELKHSQQQYSTKHQQSAEHKQNQEPLQNHPMDSQATLTDVFLRFANDGYRQRSDEILHKLLDAFRRQSTRFVGGGQHDSHDCLIHFLNDLRDEERNRVFTALHVDPRKCLTVVDKVFGGHLLTIYTCVSCGDQHRSCEPLITISLPIVRSQEERSLDDICGDKPELLRKIKGTTEPLASATKTSRHSTSVNRCFRQFTRYEEIRGEYLCQKCQMNGSGSRDSPLLTSAVKRTLVYNPPAVLVLHIKRFEQVQRRFRKRNDIIRYEDLLDLGQHCISSCHRINQQQQNVWYSLFGVIVHKGSLTRGHYVAYVKEGTTDVQDTKTFLQATYLDRDVEPTTTKKRERKREKDVEAKRREKDTLPSPGRWFYVSDQSVRRLKGAEEALNQAAYLLFYQRIGTPLQTNGEQKSSITTAL